MLVLENVITCGKKIKLNRKKQSLKEGKKWHKILLTHLFKRSDPLVRGSLVFCQKNTVPRRPFFLTIPSHKNKIINIIPATQNTLTIPDFLNQVTNVFFLKKDIKNPKHNTSTTFKDLSEKTAYSVRVLSVM